MLSLAHSVYVLSVYVFTKLTSILISCDELSPFPVVDHGTANVEITMDEALQDFPPLVRDIKERLRC